MKRLKKYSTEELLKLHRKDIEKNKTRIRISNVHLIFYFLIKYGGAILCVWFLMFCINELKEYKEVFFTYNAMEQLESMYRGNFTLLYPEINTTEVNVTPNRILSL